MLFSSVVSMVALAAAGVNAHGYVSQIVCDGKKYMGGVPSETNPKSPIRSISTINPYKDPKGAGQTCGQGAKAGALIAPVTAGSTMTLQWVAHPNQKWPHEMGPLITYMAKVPAGKTAANVDPATLDFFKVKQTGQKSPGSNKWVLEDQMKLGTDYPVTIPKNIENGDYIMRHEIIALHLADKKNGAEFYGSCFQLKVLGGTGTGPVTPTAKFPGAYSATDPGIFTPKVFDSGFKYQFPGPAIPSFNNSGSPDPETPEQPEQPEPAEPTYSGKPSKTKSVAPEPTETCIDDEEPTATESSPAPTATGKPDGDEDEDCPTPEECGGEYLEPEYSTTSSKPAKPTGKKKEHRRWVQRMEKVYIGRRS